MLPRANDDSAARLLLAEHAEERGDVRMARAWRWMAERAKWPDLNVAWWWGGILIPGNCHACEQIIADALERGEL